MPDTHNFLSEEDEKTVVAAIKEAEKNTSGEIRVHIESTSEKPPLERAQEVFKLLDMDATAAKNGVLFYVGVKNRSFAILGDEGINNVVENDFWDSTKDVVLGYFKQGLFAQGLSEGILKAGQRLKTYFPYNEDDVNELPDTISKS
ncbi:TPM domain-containing protein [Flavobacterium rhizosphaerae]|uniref:TPM domain-containing protein n=1 Tax=Flavobacterium rhizosphaerae TaxID=3163298 RepID=A0ABW8Z0E8_9FLAO